MLRKRIDEVLRNSATATLTVVGFKRRGNVYGRSVGQLQHMIDVQYSRWNTPDEVNFTMNVGIYMPGVHSLFEDRPEPQRPKPVDCSVTARVGMLRAPYVDLWWKLSAKDRPGKDRQLEADIVSTLTRTALPFLDRFATEKEVAEFLSGPRATVDQYVEPRSEGLRQAYAAIIWRMLDVRDRCQGCLDAAVRQARKTPLEDVIEAFTRRFRCRS